MRAEHEKEMEIKHYKLRVLKEKLKYWGKKNIVLNFRTLSDRSLLSGLIHSYSITSSKYPLLAMLVNCICTHHTRLNCNFYIIFTQIHAALQLSGMLKV